MSLTTSESEVRYDGDGVTTVFGFVDGATPIPFYETTDLRVFLDGVLQVSGYTVSVSNSEVTFSVAPAAGVEVFIRRVIPLTQEKSYPTNDTFPSRSHEEALDRQVMISQQLSKDIGRAISLPESSDLSDIEVPTPSAGKALKWNDDEDGLENSTYDPDEQVTLATAQAVAAAASASSASTSASTATTQAGLAATARVAAEAAQAAAEAAAGSVDGTRIQSPDTLSSIISANGAPIEVAAPNGFDLNGATLMGARGFSMRIGYAGPVANVTDDLICNMPVAGTIHSYRTETSAGAVDWTLKIDAATITGGVAVEADDTVASGSFTGATFDAGDSVTITLADSTAAEDLEVWLNVTWNG